MAEDKEVLREIWEGRLPVCFSLVTEEVSTPMAPDPFYLMISRMTFFPLVTDKVNRKIISYFRIILNFGFVEGSQTLCSVRRTGETQQ